MRLCVSTIAESQALKQEQDKPSSQPSETPNAKTSFDVIVLSGVDTQEAIAVLRESMEVRMKALAEENELLVNNERKSHE